jgi:hypothetical protein
MAPRWLLEFDHLRERPLPFDAEVWLGIEAPPHRAYVDAPACPGPGWQRLLPLAWIDGAAAGMPAHYHYVVETDVAPEHEDDFNAWYAQEHLPGLAAVPGAVQAARYRREGDGRPRYIACYRLVAPEVLGSAPWLAVRHTAWSSRVRPRFLNTRRMMFVAP